VYFFPPAASGSERDLFSSKDVAAGENLFSLFARIRDKLANLRAQMWHFHHEDDRLQGVRLAALRVYRCLAGLLSRQVRNAASSRRSRSGSTSLTALSVSKGSAAPTLNLKLL
jgi:hypothetical protein